MISQSIETAIDSLYNEFLCAPPKKVEGCPCCIERIDSCSLLAVPLRGVDKEALSTYASKALLTVGSNEDFLYFLPRILQISASSSHWWPDPEVIASRINYFGLDRLNHRQREVIDRYYKAIINELAVCGEVDAYAIDQWLCSYGYVSGRSLFSELLKTIEERVFVALVYANYPELKSCSLRNAFWEENPQKDTYLVKLTSAQIKRALLNDCGMTL